ncbi:MAG: hypothetical protein M1819_005158 [Sarea resinae]|nr:MAG: hypothetical protein M1819_005158 [Sarea resinae]
MIELPHPLDPLSADEIKQARESVLKARGESVIALHTISLLEPRKNELVPFLDAEHGGQLTSETPRPRRSAKVSYELIRPDKSREIAESIVDIQAGAEVSHRVFDRIQQPSLFKDEFLKFFKICEQSPVFKDALAQYKLPEGFVAVLEPWPYGGPDVGEEIPRLLQALVFARDTRNGNADSNHYAYPIPLIPVLDVHKGEIVRVDKLATGGTDDGLSKDTTPADVLEHCSGAEYVPELIGTELRADLKPLNVVQPDGPSFKVGSGNLVEWQKWRFRVGFTPREGAVIHDLRYDGRSVLYRLSMSEMTVPYGDPRPPYHRKQAFDFGDGGAGRAANNLQLGCDCLGVIKYFDALLVDVSGTPSTFKNVVCLHEQDNGIGWKHTNYRTGRAVVTRNRELVVQFVITLANYEYIFAFKFDQAGGIAVETRATGIVSVTNIDKGKTSPWGNVVNPGVLAQNHQHIFCLRIDPAVDGYTNTVVTEESVPVPTSEEINPFGNAYRVVTTPIKTSSSLDASPSTNLNIKITNQHHLNPISSRPVSYKFSPSPTQLLLAQPDSVMAKRAQFATHHVWVTRYRDGELWAAGEFTNQSQRETGGVADMVARQDNVEDADVVVWSVFGLTHNPRVEDWPVM